MDDIRRINLANAGLKNESIRETTIASGKKREKRKFIILGIVIVFLLWLGLGVAMPAIGVYGSAKKTAEQAKKAIDAAKKQNIVLASEELKKTHDDLVITQGKLKPLSYIQFIPLLGGYYQDANHMVKGGLYGVEAAQITIEAILPYSDVLGLKGQGSFVLGSAEERIKKTVETLDKVTPRISDINGKIQLLKKEVDQINPAFYPDIGGLKLKTQLTQAKTSVSQTATFVSEAKPLIEVLPSLLGVSKEKKYLVLFQNDKELRPTGGFLTAYAIFRIDKGIIHVDRADDMYTLDKSLKKRGKAPEIILKYLPGVTTFNLRDTNLSPDFVESMKTFNSLYQNAAGKVDVDGIIALDTNVLVSTIKILDDEVYAGGIKFTSKTDKRCDCPQVVYELERLTDQPLSLDLRVTSLESAQAHRKDIIGVLMYAIMEKALKSSPKLYWGPLVQDLVAQTSQKHVLFYLYDAGAQGGLEALNASGRIKSFDGDYLHINEANFGGQKSNLYTKEAVTQNIEVGNNGEITKTITINYKNPYPPSDCNLERGGLCLNAELRDFIRIYVPKGSQLIESQGSEVDIKTSEDLGKTVFEGFIKVRPQGSATFTIKYKLPFKKNNKNILPLFIQKQPGTTNDYQIKVNGREVEKFKLETDREFQLKI